MPLVHIDTGHNFPETIEFRDALAERLGVQLIVGSVQDTIDGGRVREETGAQASRNRLQIATLLETIENGKYDACIGGARRDEEKARAKERFFSHRDDFGQWDPKNQRPELWNLFNGKHMPGENFRVFPLNNWTELDIWNYITREQIALPSLYYAHQRMCVVRDGVILAHSEYLPQREGESPEMMQIRFRTLGDLTITGAIESDADTLEKITAEVAATRITERGGRVDDKRSETSMEDRKKEGYF
jgi:sulfate adenylyltransferase subunit 2